MATRYVAANATGSGDGTLGSPWTLKQARLNVAPGDTIECRGGVYSNAASTWDNRDGNGVNGTAALPITVSNYAAETPEFRATMRIPDTSYVTFENLRFVSPNGDGLIRDTGGASGCDHVTIQDCYFDELTAGTYTGILFRNSTFLTFTRNTLDDWFQGDFVSFFDCQRVLFSENDCGPRHRAGHSTLAFRDCERCMIHRNYFRNSIDRVLQCRGALGESEICCQWNVFVDSDWDGVSSNPTTPSSDRGANQAVRFMSPNSVFRFNLVLKTNVGQGDSYNAAHSVNFFTNNIDSRNLRVYHNTYHLAANHGLAIHVNDSVLGQFRDDDMRFLNNIISDCNGYGLWIGDAAMRWRGYQVRYNLFGDAGKTRLIYIRGGGDAQTVAEANANHSAVFKENVSGVPTFVDETIITSINASPTSYGVADLDEIFEKMQLAPGSQGEDGGRRLTRIRASASNTTTIDVDDAMFFNDGYGLVDRDQIQIGVGGPIVGVTGRVSKTRITVDSAVTVTVGDQVWLSVVGDSTPNIGVPRLGTGGSVPDSPPPVLTTDDTPPEDQEGEIIAAPPSQGTIPTGLTAQIYFPNANPRLQKFTEKMLLSGVSARSPIMAGLSAQISVDLNPGELLQSWRIYTEDGSFENGLEIDDDEDPTATIVFGTDTDSGATAVRNLLEWVTNFGITRRQFWVKNAPSSGGFYVNNQEAQSSGAAFVIGAGEPMSLGFSVLPGWSDEFYQQGSVTVNRWTNTLHGWGGALTAEVYMGSPLVQVLNERYIGDIDGYYWALPITGITPIRFRLRAALGSSNYVDLDGTITIALS